MLEVRYVFFKEVAFRLLLPKQFHSIPDRAAWLPLIPWIYLEVVKLLALDSTRTSAAALIRMRTSMWRLFAKTMMISQRSTCDVGEASNLTRKMGQPCAKEGEGMSHRGDAMASPTADETRHGKREPRYITRNSTWSFGRRHSTRDDRDRRPTDCRGGGDICDVIGENGRGRAGIA